MCPCTCVCMYTHTRIWNTTWQSVWPLLWFNKTPKVRDSHCSVHRLQEWACWVPEIGKLTSLNHKQNYWLLLWEDLVSNIACLHCQAALDFLCLHPATPFRGLIFMFCLSARLPQKLQPLLLYGFSNSVGKLNYLPPSLIQTPRSVSLLVQRSLVWARCQALRPGMLVALSLGHTNPLQEGSAGAVMGLGAP